MLGSNGKVVVVEVLVVVITGIVDVIAGVTSSQLVNLLNRPTVLCDPKSSLKTTFILKYESSGTPPMDVMNILMLEQIQIYLY